MRRTAGCRLSRSFLWLEQAGCKIFTWCVQVSQKISKIIRRLADGFGLVNFSILNCLELDTYRRILPKATNKTFRKKIFSLPGRQLIMLHKN
jgi:hypothetical protein